MAIASGDKRSTQAFIEGQYELLKQRASTDLNAALTAAISDPAASIGESALQAALSAHVPEVFEREFGLAAAAFNEQMKEVMRPHEERARRLIESVRKTAAELFDVPAWTHASPLLLRRRTVRFAPRSPSATRSRNASAEKSLLWSTPRPNWTESRQNSERHHDPKNGTSPFGGAGYPLSMRLGEPGVAAAVPVAWSRADAVRVAASGIGTSGCVTALGASSLSRALAADCGRGAAGSVAVSVGTNQVMPGANAPDGLPRTSTTAHVALPRTVNTCAGHRNHLSSPRPDEAMAFPYCVRRSVPRWAIPAVAPPAMGGRL